MILQTILALIPLGFTLINLKEKQIHKRLLNNLFNFLVLFLPYYIIAYTTLMFVQNNISKQTFTYLIFFQYLCNAIPEEIFKFLSIKMSKPKTKEDILKNSIIIATIFMFFENFLYGRNSTLVGIYRVFIPIHIISQILMSYFMSKALESKHKLKYRILSLVIPIIVHATYNCFANINFLYLPAIICVLGILTYIFLWKHLKKQLVRTDSKVILISKSKITFIFVFVALFIFLMCS